MRIQILRLVSLIAYADDDSQGQLTSHERDGVGSNLYLINARTNFASLAQYCSLIIYKNFYKSFKNKNLQSTSHTKYCKKNCYHFIN